MSDAISHKEKNDKRIKELEAELARKKIEDAEMLQDMKGTFRESYFALSGSNIDTKNNQPLAECLRAQKQFKMASQEAAKEAKTQLKVDAHKIIKVTLVLIFSSSYYELHNTEKMTKMPNRSERQLPEKRINNCVIN